MLRPYIGTRYPPPGDPDDLLDKLVVRVSSDPRCLGQTGVHRRIGNDAWERIQLDDVGDPEAVDAHVDAAPVAAAEGAIGVQRDALGLMNERCSDTGRRALKNCEWMLARVPDPLRLVAVDGWRSGGQRGEIECDDREAAYVAVVTEDRDRELRAREIRLDEDWLLVPLQKERHALRELRGRLT